MALLGNARVESVESTAMVVLALASLGIDPRSDERFRASSGNTMVDRMYDHYISNDDGTCGFAHILPAEGEPEINTLATVEGFCALTSLYRLDNGMTAFYDLRDVSFDGEKTEDGEAGNTEEVGDIENTDGSDKENNSKTYDEAEMRAREKRSLMIFLLVSAAAGVTVYILRTGKTTGKRDGKNGDEGHKKDSK